MNTNVEELLSYDNESRISEDGHILDLGDLCPLNNQSLHHGNYSEFLSQALDLWFHRIQSNHHHIHTPLSSIDRLYLNGNHLQNLPQSIQRFESLRVLNLSNNELKIIPDIIFSHLRKLWILQLSNNQIQQVSPRIKELRELRSIDLSRNYLHELPNTFTSLHRLEKLVCNQNYIESLPEGFARIVSLRELHISGNQVNSNTLVNPVASLVQLDTLSLSNCELVDLPVQMASLVSLYRVSMTSNRFEEIPRVIQTWHRLRVLDLSNNQIKSVPEWFASAVPSLQRLSLESNLLESLPENISSLDKLNYLSLLNNSNLHALPLSISRMHLDELLIDKRVLQAGTTPGEFATSHLRRTENESSFIDTNGVEIRHIRRTQAYKARSLGCNQM